jgi:hypothetical protein
MKPIRFQQKPLFWASQNPRMKTSKATHRTAAPRFELDLAVRFGRRISYRRALPGDCRRSCRWA